MTTTDQKIHRMGPETACFCGTGRLFGKCCGMLLKRKSCAIPVVSVRNGAEKAIRWFLVGPGQTPFTGDTDKVLVYPSMARTLQQVEQLQEQTGVAYAIVGLSAQRFDLFASEVPHTLMSAWTA